MKLEAAVAQIMSKNLKILTTKQTLYEAELMFKKHGIRHIPVVDQEQLVGILSYSDLLKISYADVTEGTEDIGSIIYDMFTIPQVMAKVLVTVSADTSIREVIKILAKQTFHSLPVVEDNGKLVGIVTTTDLLNYFLEEY